MTPWNETVTRPVRVSPGCTTTCPRGRTRSTNTSSHAQSTFPAPSMKHTYTYVGPSCCAPDTANSTVLLRSATS